MKKLITSLLITTSVLVALPAKANADVIGALIIGGLIGHAISDNDKPTSRPVDVYVYPGTQAHPIYVPPPVYTPPRYNQRYYYPGHSPNPVYELMPVYDSSCNCRVMMPVRVR